MRLTVEAVREAFELSGLIPERKMFKVGPKGCAMQAYADAHEKFNGRPSNVSLLEVGQAYFEGFTTGWDEHPPLPDERVITQYGIKGAMRYYDGIEDGKAAAEEMFSSDRLVASLA